MAPRLAARAPASLAGLLWVWALLAVEVSDAGSLDFDKLRCEEAGTIDRGTLGLRPRDVGICLPDVEPQLPRVNDYKMVIDVADWESNQLVSMIMGILLSEHLGYDVIFNYGPLAHETRRLLVPLPPMSRPKRGLELTPWFWDRSSQERRKALGQNLACVADESRRFSVLNMEVWNVQFGPGNDWVGEGLIRGDGLGYHGQSGWFIPAMLGEGVGNLWTTFANLKGEPPEEWRGVGFKTVDFVNCSDNAHAVCTPERGRATNDACRVWCPKSHALTIPLWAVHPSYDQGYSEEIISNNKMDISLHFLGQQEHERKVAELFNGTGATPGPVLFYSWEPSTLLHRVRALAKKLGKNKHDLYEVSRLFLPNSKCKGPHMDIGPPDSTYRCDLPQQYLMKLSSLSMKEEASFAFDFLRDFTIGQTEIEKMLDGLLSNNYVDASPEQRHRLIFDVACNWVHSASRKGDGKGSFYWPKYSRPAFWYSNLAGIGKIFLRNGLYGVIALVTVILVERLWVSSTLCSEHSFRRMIKSIFKCMSGEKRGVTRAGTSLNFTGSESFQASESEVDMDFEMVFVPSEVHNDHDGGDAAEHLSQAQVRNDYDGADAPEEHLPEAQVCSETLWCKETDEAVTIGVLLSQSWKEQVRIGYCLEDGTGKQGERYEAKEGELVFEPNELVKSVDVRILDSQDWDAGTFFDFHLVRRCPEHALLKPGCAKTRVQIVNTDPFPKSKHTSDEARARMSKRAALFEHLWNEYGRLKSAWWRVMLGRLYSAVHETLVLPLVQKILLDSAVGRQRQTVNYQLVLILGAILVAATCCKRVAEHQVVKYSKGAAVMAELQMMLFNKLWMISSLTRDTKIKPSRWIATVMRHTKDVAEDGWCAVPELISDVISLLLIVFLAFLLVSDTFSERIEPMMVVPPVLLLALVPVSWLFVFKVRRPGQIKKREELDIRTTRVYDGFNWLTMQGKDLVLMGRGKSSHFLEQLRRDFLRDTLKAAQAYTADNVYQTDSGWVALWMATVIHVCYFITGGYMLIESKHYGQGTLGVGSFVAMLVNVVSFGQALRRVFDGLLRIENASYALHQISELLNSPSEEASHMERQKAEFEQFLPGLRLAEQGRDKILFRNVTFAYAERTRRLVEHFEAELPLGRISVLKDMDSSVNQFGGQITLLRLVAGDLMPTDGQVLLPPYLRVGVVETTPALIGDSLLKHVTVLAIDDGAWGESAPACASRSTTLSRSTSSLAHLNSEAWQVAQELGMQALPQLLDTHALPSTSCIAHTARVMLSDPDVLIVVTSRWQGGQWLGKFMSGLVRWQEHGLKALMGKEDPKDRARQRTLLLTADTSGLEHLEVGDIYEIVHVEGESEGMSRSYLTAPHNRGSKPTQCPNADAPAAASPTSPRDKEPLTPDDGSDRQLSAETGLSI